MTQQPGARTIICLLTCAILTAIGCQRHYPAADVKQFGSAELFAADALRMSYIEASINGSAPIRLLVDTGAGAGLILAPALLDQLDLTPRPGGMVAGLGGSVQTDAVDIDELRIGSVVCANAVAMCPRDGGPLLVFFEGIIGCGFFGSARVTLDFSDGAFHVAPSGASAGADPGVAFKLGPQGHILMNANLDGVDARAMLDSGANVSLLATAWHTRHGQGDLLKTPAPMAGLGDQMQTADLAGFATLEFAGKRIEPFGVTVNNAFATHLQMPIDLIIGMDVLTRAHRVEIDYGAKRVWLDWIP